MSAYLRFNSYGALWMEEPFCTGGMRLGAPLVPRDHRGQVTSVSLSCRSLIGGSGLAFQYWKSTFPGGKGRDRATRQLVSANIFYYALGGGNREQHLKVPCSAAPLSVPTAAKWLRVRRAQRTAAYRVHLYLCGVAITSIDVYFLQT